MARVTVYANAARTLAERLPEEAGVVAIPLSAFYRDGEAGDASSHLRLAFCKDVPTIEQALERLDAWWRAANYLSVGQIYLLDNPLLRTPLTRDHVKPRLLGHWGTTPGLTFLYAHFNRAIRQRGLNACYVTGPGHGAPEAFSAG